VAAVAAVAAVAISRIPSDCSDDWPGIVPAVRRDQGESHRDLRRRRTETRDRNQDRQVPADTGRRVAASASARTV